MEKELIKYLKSQIEKFGELQNEMDIGKRYFKQENDILTRKKFKGIAIEDKKTSEKRYVNVEDTTRANHRLPSAFAKLQITQKVSYSLNDDLSVTNDEEIYKELIPDWKIKLKKSAMKVSQTIYEAWQPYLEDKKLKFNRIPGDQIIVDFESSTRDNEKRIIRHYMVDGVERAEIWDEYKVVIFEKKKKWTLVETRSHIQNQLVNSRGEVIDESGESWGIIPIIVLYNNDEMETDVKPIKEFVDIYDITNSDFANNIDDFQEILTVLKGYGGSDPSKVLNLIKKMGGINIAEGGSVDYKQGIIPTEAREVALKQFRKDIFDAGMAVDTENMAKGNVTNNIIASMYENLNMKASGFEQELQDFWRKINFIINRYFEMMGIDTRVSGELVFDRTILVNQKERAEENKIDLENLSLLSGFVSEEMIAEIINNLEFVKKNSNMTKEEILKSVLDKSQDFLIEE